MAQHNPQSRSYLLIVLAAIVVCFVIAQLILGGGESDKHTATDHDGGAAMETSEEGHAGMPEEVPARTHMDDAMGEDAAMSDDVSPPDEMEEEPPLEEEAPLDEEPAPNP